jgi:hypothetical protein
LNISKSGGNVRGPPKKIIKNKLALLRLAEMLGNVSQVCKVIGYSRDSLYLLKELDDTAGTLP